MTQSPAFQLYARDFLEGTAGMNNAETGAYIKLLCHQWLKNGLSNDMSILTRLCSGDEQGIQGALDKFKKDRKGRLKNKRLEIERKSQEKKSKINSKNGKQGAQKRWSATIKKTNELNGEAFISPMANHSPAAATATALKQACSLLTEKVFEIMRRSTGKNYSDEYLTTQAEEFVLKYGNKKIGDLGALVGGWMRKVEPDIKPKKMVH